MADIKISQLTAKAAKVESNDRIPIADFNGTTYDTKYVTGAEINEIKLDTSPQLGGNLDVNGNTITSASNGNIIIEPNGTGAVLIGGNSTQPTELRFMEDSDNGTNYVALKASNSLSTDTTYTLPTADGTSGQVLQTNGTGTLSWTNNDSGLTVNSTAITSGTAGRIFFQNSSNQLSQSAGLSWNDSTKILTVGVSGGDSQISFPNTTSGFVNYIRSEWSQNRIRTQVGNSFIELTQDRCLLSPSSGTATFNVSSGNHIATLRINNSDRFVITGSDPVNMSYFVNTNLALGGTSVGTSSNRVFAQYSGTAPGSSPADAYQQYSADITTGNAAPHFRTENGNVVKLYQETTGVAAATLVSNAGTSLTSTDTFDGYTLQQVVKALKNLGILA
jgi:hypothetical protein